MLAKRIIPCLDVDHGRVKKGVNFVHLTDVGDPVAIAAAYEKQGADELVFLDITATNEKRPAIVDTIEKVAAQVFMPLTVGGGQYGRTRVARPAPDAAPAASDRGALTKLRRTARPFR